MAKGRKTGGRRPGSLNKATIEVKAACAELVDDPEYRRRLGARLRHQPPEAYRPHVRQHRRRLRKCRYAFACTRMHVVYYVKGKPKEAIESDQHLTIRWQGELVDPIAATAETRRLGLREE